MMMEMSGNKTLSTIPLPLVVVLHSSFNPFLETGALVSQSPAMTLWRDEDIVRACNESKRL